MEFKFRAGEASSTKQSAPNSSTTTTMFTRQHLRAAVLSNDNGRRTQPESESNPVAVSEAIEREIEKRQIREEILASEIVRRRELEAEVMRELMEERAAVMMGAENQGFSFYNSSAVPTPLSRSELRGMLPLHYEKESGTNPPAVESLGGFPVQTKSPQFRAAMAMGAENQGFSFYNSSAEPTPLLRSGLRGMLPLHYEKESGTNPLAVESLRGLRVQPKSPVVQLLHQTTTAEEANPINSTAVNVKRKAETLETDGGVKQQDGRTCYLCNVSTTDVRGLQEHLEGKKHKAKEKRADNKLHGKSEQAVSTGSLNPKQGESSNEEDKMPDTKAMMGDGGLPEDKKQQHMKCWCQMCKFETNSEAEIITHMMGEMHRTLLLENGGCVIAMSTLPEYAQEGQEGDNKPSQQRLQKEMSIPLVLPVGEKNRLKVDDHEESGKNELS